MSKKFQTSGIQIGSGIVGGVASNGLVGAIPYGTTKIKRVAVIVLSVALMVFAKLKGTLGEVVNGASAGMAITQGGELVTELISNKPQAVTGQAGSFIKGMANRGMGNSLSGRYSNIARVNGSAARPQMAARPQANASMSAIELMQLASS